VTGWGQTKKEGVKPSKSTCLLSLFLARGAGGGLGDSRSRVKEGEENVFVSVGGRQ